MWRGSSGWGWPARWLPNTLSISFRGLQANAIISALDRVACSAGAACHADEIAVSPVLRAMRLPRDYAMGTIRFSLGRMTKEAEIEQALAAIVETVRRLRPAG